MLCRVLPFLVVPLSQCQNKDRQIEGLFWWLFLSFLSTSQCDSIKGDRSCGFFLAIAEELCLQWDTGEIFEDR